LHFFSLQRKIRIPREGDKTMKKVFSVFVLSLMLTACGGGGGGGSSDTPTDTGSGTTDGDQTPTDGNGEDTGDPGGDCPVVYTTVDGMPIYVDFWGFDDVAPLVRLNLGCGKWIEFELWPTGTGLAFRTESSESEQIYLEGGPAAVGQSLSFADGYLFTLNGYADCTITTPRGEKLQFSISDLSRLYYDSGNGTTFKAMVQNNNPGAIVLMANGVNYGPLRYPPGGIDPNPGDAIGYEDGYRWGFDIQ
jgi:hypothetical protein